MRSYLVPPYLLMYFSCMPVAVTAIESRSWTRALRRSSSTTSPDRDISTDEKYDAVEEKYFTQTLNHFDLKDNRGFQQRYFQRTIAGSNSDTTIAFICVGGEGPPLDESVLVDSVHCTGDMIETAKVVSSLFGYTVQMLALEHRFYGKSFPFSNSTDLSLLSSRQAVEDLAHFASSVHGTSQGIYVFGGSYPGMLAAFSRTKYPFLFKGAVSNSAPVQAKLDFHEYSDHVGADIRECFDIVKQGHTELAAYMKTASQRQVVTKMFQFCNESALESRRNQELFLGDGVVYFGAQEDDPSCTGSTNCNLHQKCSFLKEVSKNGTSLDALASLSKVEQNGECIDVDWEAIVQYISNPANDETRSWLWQTCTEFGFYQTCTTEQCPYATGFHRVEQDLELCRRAYGVEPDESVIAQTNEWSGGWNVNDPRILSVVGTVDPWTELATATGANVVAGASHHFWTHQPKNTDSDAIRSSRALIVDTVLAWMDEDLTTYGNILASQA